MASRRAVPPFSTTPLTPSGPYLATNRYLGIPPSYLLMSLRARDLDVTTSGRGPRVVFVHGSIVDAGRTWRRQLGLAERWTLVLPNRPGFAGSPPLERNDFELEAPLIA